MIATLSTVPETEVDWQAYSLAHRDSHARIRQAIQAQHDIRLLEYVLEPVVLSDLEGFLARNQQSHYEASPIAGVQMVNLEGVDFRDRAQFEAWIALHSRAHRDLEIALGIGS